MFDFKDIILPKFFEKTFLSKNDFFIISEQSVYSGELLLIIKVILILMFGLFISKFLNIVTKFRKNYIYVTLIIIMIVSSVFMQQYSYPFIYFKF